MNDFKPGQLLQLEIDDSFRDEHPVTHIVKCSDYVRFPKDEIVRCLDVSPGWVRVSNSMQDIAWLVSRNVRPVSPAPDKLWKKIEPGQHIKFSFDPSWGNQPKYFIHKKF